MVKSGMSKYIESEYLENIVDYYLGHSNGAEHYAFGVMRGELRVAPAADVVEVKHGSWIVNDEIMYCSVCGYETSVLRQYVCNGEKWLPVDAINYCGNCGAKMDQEDKT